MCLILPGLTELGEDGVIGLRDRIQLIILEAAVRVADKEPGLRVQFVTVEQLHDQAF